MPELAELALMRDFVNRHSIGHIFHLITRSDCSTGKIGRSPLIQLPAQWNQKFKLHAISRGKEMKAIFINSALESTQVIDQLKQQVKQRDAISNHNNNNDDNNQSTSLVRKTSSSTRITLAARQASTGADATSDPNASYISVLFRAGMTGMYILKL